MQITQAEHGLAANASITIERSGAVGGIANSNINGSRTVAEVIENTYEITAVVQLLHQVLLVVVVLVLLLEQQLQNGQNKVILH